MRNPHGDSVPNPTDSHAAATGLLHAHDIRRSADDGAVFARVVRYRAQLFPILKIFARPRTTGLWRNIRNF